jgi:hypothetical protein
VCEGGCKEVLVVQSLNGLMESGPRAYGVVQRDKGGKEDVQRRSFAAAKPQELRERYNEYKRGVLGRP